MSAIPVHVVIPDSQVKSGVPLDYLPWIGEYIVESFAGRKGVKIIHLGDFADMESLSSYDHGKKQMEGRRYKRDIAAANYGWALLNGPLEDYNETRRRFKEKRWLPERHLLLGNHEDRINRATADDAKLDGTISTDDLDYARTGWEVHPFKQVVDFDGVAYSHYFYNPMTGNPYGGQSIEGVALRLLGGRR